MSIKDELDPEIILLGDSITHLWGGLPEWTGRAAMGPKSFAKTFTGKRVLNLGYGYDRIQNVLWRLDHGEVRGLNPKHVVLNIGTNNLWPSKKAKGNSSEEIAEGIRAILIRLRSQLPSTKITLMGIFPRGQSSDDPSRKKVAEVNALLKPLAKEAGITFIDLGDQLVQPDGTISREMMPDFLHPAEPAYAIWGEALKEIVLD